MNSNKGELDIEKAGSDALELVLLGSAQRAGLFSALIEEKDIATLSRELDANGRALYIVLEALCSLGYADRKNENRYVITARARSLFLERGGEYVGGYLPHLMRLLEAWLALPEMIKGEETERADHPDVPSFMHAMASKPDESVEDVVSRCLERKREAENVLDLGGGPGKYARAFVKRGLKAVLYDTPETIDYVATEFGLEGTENLTLKKGDFTEKDFVSEFSDKFDIVFMGNICHIYSAEENSELISNARKLMREDGLIAIEDFVRGRSPRAEMFAVNMLANTEGGNTWTEPEYRGWLEEAGFHDIEVIDLDDGEKQLITAFLGQE